MNKLNFIFCTLGTLLILACVSKQVGLKENWIDERDVIALASNYVSDWMVKAGRPTLVEINNDTSIYYYNYRPTMYATTVYDSTTFIATWGTAKETKPSLENSTEVWGSRRNVMQIKVVNNIAVSATVIEGPDKKTFIRDLNGDLILDQSSGYNSNISEEQKIDKNSDHFKNAYNKLYSKDSNATKGTNMNPWEYYRYKQQLDAKGSVATESTEFIAEPIAPEHATPAEPHTATPEHATPAEPHTATPASLPNANGH